MSNRHPIYQKLIGLYPKAYRDKYGSQIVQTLDDMLGDATKTTDKVLIWTKVAADLPINLIKVQFAELGAVMQQETPRYIKENGLLAAVLVLPFFVALVANGLDKLINNHSLNNSWLWHMPYLGIWVLWLPATALVLSLINYVRYSVTKHKALDIKRIWPIIVPGLLASGILFILFFHDSLHCLAQNPVTTLRHWHQTWQCTQIGYLGGNH